jgi:hypothetical protein
MSDVQPRTSPVPSMGASSPRVSDTHNVRDELVEQPALTGNRPRSASATASQSAPAPATSPITSGPGVPPSPSSAAPTWGRPGAGVGLPGSFALSPYAARFEPGPVRRPHGSPPRPSSGTMAPGFQPSFGSSAWGNRAGFEGSPAGLPPVPSGSSVFRRPSWSAGSPPSNRGSPTSGGPLPTVSTADTVRPRAASAEGLTLTMPRTSKVASSRSGKGPATAHKPTTRASARAQSGDQPRPSGSPPNPSPLRAMESSSSLAGDPPFGVSGVAASAPDGGAASFAAVDPAVNTLLSTVLPDELRKQLQLYAAVGPVPPGMIPSRPPVVAPEDIRVSSAAPGPPAAAKPTKKATGPSRSKKAAEKVVPAKASKRPAPVAAETSRRLRSRVDPGPRQASRSSGRAPRDAAPVAADPPVAAGAGGDVPAPDGPHTPQEIHHDDVEQLPNPRGLVIRPYSTPCLTCVKVIAQDPTKTCTFKGPYKSCLECAAKHLGYCQAVSSSAPLPSSVH